VDWQLEDPNSSELVSAAGSPHYRPGLVGEKIGPLKLFPRVLALFQYCGVLLTAVGGNMVFLPPGSFFLWKAKAKKCWALACRYPFLLVQHSTVFTYRYSTQYRNGEKEYFSGLCMALTVVWLSYIAPRFMHIVDYRTVTARKALAVSLSVSSFSLSPSSLV